jgi:hypothetical protein
MIGRRRSDRRRARRPPQRHMAPCCRRMRDGACAGLHRLYGPGRPPGPIAQKCGSVSPRRTALAASAGRDFLHGHKQARLYASLLGMTPSSALGRSATEAPIPS